MSLYIVMPEGTTVHGLRDALDSAAEGPQLSAHMAIGAATDEARRLAKVSRKPYVVMKLHTVTYHPAPHEPKGA
jgi:hypothetical protein